MTKEDVVAQAWGDSVCCDNVWCGEVYDASEGWGGRCPSCLALTDEHLAGAHAVLIDACALCRRRPSPPSSAFDAAAGRDRRAG